MDSLGSDLCKPSCKGINRGEPIVQNCGQPFQVAPSTVEVIKIDAETHVNGRFIFPVHESGELYEKYKVPTMDRIHEIEIWGPPRKLRGADVFTGKIPIHGGITVWYWEGTNKQSLHVWPSPVEPTPGQPGKDESDLLQKAIDVANWLGKYGGWRFGNPRYSSNEGKDGGFHRAIYDKAITDNLPDDYVPNESSGFYIDNTPEPKSLETTGKGSAERADAIINFPQITKDLKDADNEIKKDLNELKVFAESSFGKIDDLDERSLKLLTITERLYSSIENLTSISMKQIESYAEECVSRAEILARDPPKDMYR